MDIGRNHHALGPARLNVAADDVETRADDVAGKTGAVIGNRLHLVSGVVQSQSPLPGTSLATEIHEVLDLPGAAP